MKEHNNQDTTNTLVNKAGVTLWPCHLHYKVSYSKKRIIMETQILHHAKIIPNLQNNPLKETKIL
jgi:hypothetical protein